MKYELDKSVTKKAPNGETLYRVRALKDFDTIIGRKVKKGDLGGWVTSEDRLSQDDNCWIFDECMMYGKSYRFEDSVGFENSQQYGDSRQFGYSRQYGVSQQYGESKTEELQHLCYGDLVVDITENKNIKHSLMCQLNVLPTPDGTFILYKDVNKTNREGTFSSCYDSSFKYISGKYAEADDAEISTKSCAAGLHAAGTTYWSEGDTLIAVKIHIDDVITVQRGKVRCRKLFVLGEVDI